jgi:hypothetical protein
MENIKEFLKTYENKIPYQKIIDEMSRLPPVKEATPEVIEQIKELNQLRQRKQDEEHFTYNESIAMENVYRDKKALCNELSREWIELDKRVASFYRYLDSNPYNPQKLNLDRTIEFGGFNVFSKPILRRIGGLRGFEYNNLKKPELLRRLGNVPCTNLGYTNDTDIDNHSD